MPALQGEERPARLARPAPPLVPSRAAEGEGAPCHILGSATGGHRFCRLASSATLAAMFPRNWKTVVILLVGAVAAAAWAAVILQWTVV